MSGLQGAITKHNGMLEQVCGRLSSLEEFNYGGAYAEGGYEDYECEEGEVNPQSEKQADTSMSSIKPTSAWSSVFRPAKAI